MSGKVIAVHDEYVPDQLKYDIARNEPIDGSAPRVVRVEPHHAVRGGSADARFGG
ncbi:hypothetical protein ACWIGI_20695 [Nocardia sp. NPDC055321]